MELKEGGEIYVNGNKVNELMLNGKHFFQGDAKVALDNLPAYMVSNVKAYQRADDKAYLDKHHEEMKKKDPWVIDVNLKRQYNTGWIGNAEGGYGTGNRYMGRVFMTRFTDHSRLTLYANTNNINNMGRPGGEGSWADHTSPTGETDLITAGIDLHVDSRLNKTEMNTNLNASRNKTTNHTDMSTVTFLPSGDVYNRNRSQNESTSSSINWSMDVQMPKKESFLMLRPTINYSHTKTNGQSHSVTFNADPQDAYRGQSIDSIFAPLGSKRLEEFLVNRTLDQTKSTRDNLTAAFFGNYGFIAPWNGEVVDFTVNFSHNRQDSKDFSKYDLRYPSDAAADTSSPSEGSGAANDYRNRYTFNPTRNTQVRASFMHDFFEFDFGTIGINYDFSYSYNKGHRDLHRLDQYADWGTNSKRPIGLLPSTTDSLNVCIDWQNSYHTVTSDFGHNTSIGLQKGGDWGFFFLMAGINRQHNHIEDTRNHSDHTLTRTFTLPSVEGMFKVGSWEGNISYNQSAPSMNYLLNLRDDSNPLSVSLGNPNLKNSSNENFYLNYSHKNIEKQSNWYVGMSISATQNSIGNALTYNRETGVSTYRPENINGNWDASLGGSLTLPIDKQKLWTFTNSPNISYQRSVDFSQESSSGDAAENLSDLAISRVNNILVGDHMQLRFQKGGYTASLNAQANYTHADSKRQNFHSINTVDFSYGASCTLKLPWALQIDMDITMHSRRGYEDATMNENNLVWNAALSKSVLKNKSLIIKLIGHDILQQLSSVQRNINAQGRTETWYNTQPSYGLITLAYKLNVMPKKKKE